MTLPREITAWLVTLLQVTGVAGFIAYLWGLRALRSRRRPRVPARNRFGELLGEGENPKPRP